MLTKYDIVKTMDIESPGYLVQLSTELLIKIFKYLDLPEICKLRQSCKRFHKIIDFWDHLLIKNTFPLVTNQENSLFLTRCQRPLSNIEKIRISRNWQIGKYKQKSLLFTKVKYMPWLHLSSKSVWMSRGKSIYGYERFRSRIDVSTPTVVQGKSSTDVGHFRIKNDKIISGQSDGSIWLYSLKDRKMFFDEKNCHDSDINSVDISENGDIIVSGSRDSSFKIWEVDYNSETAFLKKSYDKICDDRVLRVSLLDEEPFLAVSTSGVFHRAPLFIYNLERISDPQELSTTQYAAGILDMKWDGPHSIWTCGYDTCLRRWDLRTGRCEQCYYDPHGSALYCLEYDYCNTIMTGAQSYGRVILWDTRQPYSVQLYFMGCCKGTKSSPTYSLSFDSECLFTATDRHLNILNFFEHNGIVQDYSFCCKV